MGSGAWIGGFILGALVVGTYMLYNAGKNTIKAYGRDPEAVRRFYNAADPRPVQSSFAMVY